MPIYGTAPTAVWTFDGTDYSDITYDVQRLGLAQSNILTSDDSYLYVGFNRRFDAMMFWINATVKYDDLRWYISAKNSNGDLDWKRFVPSQSLPFDFRTSRAEAVGSVARAQAEIDENGKVVRINVLEGGSGYGGTPTVTIMGGGGSGATAVVFELDGGRIETIQITSGGMDYTSPPQVTISGQSAGNFSAHDYVRWDANHPAFDAWRKMAFTNSLPHAITDINTDADTVKRYWVRVNGTPMNGNNTVLTALTIRPFASIATAEDVREQLQFREKFPDDAEFDGNQYNFPDNSNGQTFPLTEKIVERYIRGAEDSIYFITGQYYRPEFQEYELLDFRAYGMALRHRPVLHVYDLAVHNGNDWETKEEGKNHDWHMEYELGMIYISTLFMDVVPPILRRGYSERRNQGSFKRGVRVSYVHGHDTTDRMAMEVNRIVTKQACIDIISNNDFAWLMPQSLDRVSLERKVQLWREEIEEFKSRYAKLFLF